MAGEFAVGAADPGFDLATYYPIFIYLLAVVAFAGGTLVAAHTIGPKKHTPVKMMPYESGMDPVGDARQRFDIKFYLVAIMFLVFDVELLFLYPWAVAAYRDEPWLPVEMGHAVFWAVLVFIGLLFVAYLYDWKKGVFRWR
jgi:NADH-quinone oxidoreductase subunit A